MARARRHHVVGADDAAELGALLSSWDEPVRAISEGRVFVNRRRCGDSSLQLSHGDLVEIFAAPRSSGTISIVERRGDLVVIDKPSGIPAEPDEHGSVTSAREQARALFGGHVHAASRLDVGVSGLMTLALSARAERQLAEQRKRGGVQRMYLALAGKTPAMQSGLWSEPILRGRRVQKAETRYQVLAQLDGGACLLELRPITGRLHQLRFHASRGGAALLGDRRYGGARRWTLADGAVLRFERVMLHSARLRLEDEARQAWQLSSSPPRDFSEHYRALGGVGSPDELADW